MTVRELIKKLRKMPQNVPVILSTPAMARLLSKVYKMYQEDNPEDRVILAGEDLS